MCLIDFKFNSFSVIYLNVRGLRDAVKRKAVFFLFCKSSESDIILLQETHSCEMDVKFWRNQWGNIIYCSHHGSSHSAGVNFVAQV